MSGDEDFLSRWSRRKREVAASEKPPETPPPQAISSASDRETHEVPFDPATLPPIDSITALSDIRDFLRAGVPPELTRAALRRVWAADPAIRDFVGLAENAWDFTDPNAMPGFGPLEATDDVRQMVAQIMEGLPKPAEVALAPEPPPQGTENVASSDPGPPEQETEISEQRPAPLDVAMQQDSQVPADEKPSPRRTHGSALPH